MAKYWCRGCDKTKLLNDMAMLDINKGSLCEECYEKSKGGIYGR